MTRFEAGIEKLEGALDRDAVEKLYDDLAPTLEPKLYPSLAALGNVYLEALRQDKDAGRSILLPPTCRAQPCNQPATSRHGPVGGAIMPI